MSNVIHCFACHTCFFTPWIFLIFMGLKPVEYLDGTIAKRKKKKKNWQKKSKKEELNRMIRQLEKRGFIQKSSIN
ncbi:hypothetical protein LOS19_11755 [Enterococcus faecium]|nr:hypothetical protein [Enterococcus faecium]